MGELTHFNEQGRARMVDVTEKAVTPAADTAADAAAADTAPAEASAS